MTYVIKIMSTDEIADILFADSFAGWSYDGAKALAEYLEQYAEDIGENIEFDYVALRCEFNEYTSLGDFNKAYNSTNPFLSWDEVAENTTVIQFCKGSAIVGGF